jgi:hypothetical protein
MRKMGARKQGCKSVNMPARFTPLLSILVTFGKTSCTTLDVRPPPSPRPTQSTPTLTMGPEAR